MKSIPREGNGFLKKKDFEIEFPKERHEPVEMPRAVGKKPLNPVSGGRQIATGQGQQGVGGTAVSSNLGVGGGAGTNMGCIFDYARFRMTLNSFSPLKNQRVKGLELD